MNVASPFTVAVCTVALAVVSTDTFVVPERFDPVVATRELPLIAPEHVICVVATENIFAVEAVFIVVKNTAPPVTFRVVATFAVETARVVTFAVVRLPVVTNALEVFRVVTLAVTAVTFVVVSVLVTAKF